MLKRRRSPVQMGALGFLCVLSMLFMAGCAPKPGVGVAERAITVHFEQRGYRVKDLSIGKISRNPIAEREYMAPLTYVVEVPSITLEATATAGTVSERQGVERLTFSGATVKIQALSQPEQGWVVSQVSGINLP